MQGDKNAARRVTRWVVVAAAAVLVALIVFTGLFRVGPGEVGLVLTLGRVTDTKSPGLYWHMPLVQTHRVGSVSTIFTMEYGFRTLAQSRDGTAQYSDAPDEGVMLTGDGNLVSVEATLQYQINDLRDYLYEVESPEDTLRLVFETVMRRNIQNKQLDDALLNKEVIEREVLPDLQRALDHYRIGISARVMRIQNISVPGEVKAAYEDVNNAMNEKTRKLDEAEKYKNQVLPVARSNAYKVQQEAEAYMAQTVAQAQGDAMRFESILSEYKSAPQITKDRLMIETLQKILQNTDRKLILNDGGALKLLPIEALPTNAPVADEADEAVKGGAQ